MRLQICFTTITLLIPSFYFKALSCSESSSTTSFQALELRTPGPVDLAPRIAPFFRPLVSSLRNPGA
jgi:hypothetical protein